MEMLEKIRLRERMKSAMLKYSNFLIQLPSDRNQVVFYHPGPDVNHREVVDGFHSAILAAYRPIANAIVSVEMVPLIARNSEYYPENRWIVEMEDEELASLMYRSDVYIKGFKVSVMSVSQAMSMEKSREFRDQLKMRMARANQPKPEVKAHLQRGRRASRAPKVLNFMEDPKTAVGGTS